MQAGLHIGLGCWVHSRQSGVAPRPAIPSVALPLELRHISSVESAADLARISELSVLANRLNDGTATYRSGSEAGLLWERHREIINEMDSATSTLSSEERADLAWANQVLYRDDGFTISERHALYRETRRIHEDLVLAGAEPNEVADAYQNWLTLGHKVDVEEALATKVTLSRETSRVVAAQDRTRIDNALDTIGGNVPHVPTQFTPISALSTENWESAEVDLEALDKAIHGDVDRSDWTIFKGRKTGHVRFRFAAIDLIRPWFTESIYEADDWRLPGADRVSDGTGSNGRLPSYYSKAYLVQVEEVRQRPVKPAASLSTPAMLSVNSGVAAGNNLAANRLRPPLTTPLVRTRSAFGATMPRAYAVLAASSAGRSARNAVAIQTIGTPGALARIEVISSLVATQRLEFALMHIQSHQDTPKPEKPKPTWLVGFGSTNLPASPNPNPNHQWN